MRRLYSSAGLLHFLAVGKSSSRHRLTAGRSGKIKLTCVVFVAPPSFIAMQRIAVRRIVDRIVLYGHDGLAARLLDGFVTTFVRTDSFEAVWTALNPSGRLLNRPDGCKYVWTALKRAAGFKSVPNIYTHKFHDFLHGASLNPYSFIFALVPHIFHGSRINAATRMCTCLALCQSLPTLCISTGKYGCMSIHVHVYVYMHAL